MCSNLVLVSRICRRCGRDVLSHEDLGKAQPPPGSLLYRDKHERGALNRPLMRNVHANGTLSMDRI